MTPAGSSVYRRENSFEVTPGCMAIRTHNELMIRQVQFIERTLLLRKPVLEMSGSGVIIQNMGILVQ